MDKIIGWIVEGIGRAIKTGLEVAELLKLDEAEVWARVKVEIAAELVRLDRLIASRKEARDAADKMIDDAGPR